MANAPKFEANIGADISDFMRKASTVDKTIRKMATGVIVEIGANIREFMSNAASVQSTIEGISRNATVTVTGDISDLRNAISEANSEISSLNDESTININGNTSGFDRAARNVNSSTSQLSRRVTEAQIGADIGSFENRMVEVMRALTEADDTVTPQITADISEFQRDITTVEGRMREIARSTADPNVEADIAGFMAQMAAVQTQLNSVVQLHDIDVDADTGGFFAKMALVRATMASFGRNRVMIPIRSSWNNYQATMGLMASFSRNFSEIIGMTAGGIKIALSPAIVPVLASVVGLLGQLGPMLGTIGGSTFALGSAFATAGIGAAAFGAIAVTNLKDIFGASEDLKKLDEKLTKAEGWEERSKIMKEIEQVQGSLNAEQAKGLDAMNQLKSTWSGIAGALQTQTIQIFTKALGILSGVLVTLKPMFTTVMDAANGLIDSLGQSINSEPMQAFFNYLNTSAAPMLDTVSKAVGNFFQGFFSMMTAFGPLATETAGSFLKMSESFAEWSAGLSKSQKFQEFVSYVSENMPKIRSIFSDAIQGMINMFAAFAPSSADMMTGLKNMMERFKEWSTTLAESQGFKNFIDYIKTNGPVVVSTIGEIVTFIKNLGVALAPTGEKILSLVNSFVDWSNSMLEAHPWLGKIAAGAIVLVGGLAAIAPAVLLANSLFGKMILSMVKMVAKMTWTAATYVAKWTLMAAQSLIQAARMATAWVIAMGPIGWITAAVVALVVLIIANWDKVKEWTIKAWSATSEFISESWSKIVKWTSDAASKVYEWVRDKFQSMKDAIQQKMDEAQSKIKSIWTAIKSFFTTTLGNLLSEVKSKFTNIVNSVREKMENAKTTIQNKWEEAKSAAVNKITSMVSSVVTKFTEIVSNVQSKMSEAKRWVETKWEEAKSAATTKIAAMVSAVTSKFSEIVSKVSTKMSEAKTALSNKWEEAKSATSTKLSSLVSTVTTFFSDVVSKVKTKMSEAVTAVGTKVGEMPGKVREFVSDMLSAGGDLVQGLIDGIKNMGSSAVEAISGVVGGVIDKAKNLLSINSPSRVFSEFGGFISEGLAVGVNKNASMAVDSIAKVSSDMTKAFNPNLSLQAANVEMSRIDVGSEMDELRRRVKQELNVSMDVNHSGSTGTTGGGINQTVNLYSPRELSPSENARKMKQASRQLAMEWGV